VKKTANKKGGRASARTATRVLHVQRVVDGRTYQHDVVARFDHATQEYVLTEAQRANTALAIAAQVATEPASPARFVHLREAIGRSQEEIAWMLDVPVATLAAWESGAAPLSATAWRNVADLVCAMRGTK
jgi:DNA-binding transcriptional regulator YiaG